MAAIENSYICKPPASESSGDGDGLFKMTYSREFPGGLVVRILGFHCRGPGSIPGWGTEIPQTVQCGQKKDIFQSP